MDAHQPDPRQPRPTPSIRAAEVGGISAEIPVTPLAHLSAPQGAWAEDAPALPGRSARPEPHTFYCLWQHVEGQVPDLEEKILARCRGRSIDHIGVYQEAVGGLPYHRPQIERYMNGLISDRGEVSWRLGSWACRAITSLAERILPEGPLREELLDRRFALRQIEMLRRIRRETGAAVELKLIDMDEGHIDYCLVREAGHAALRYAGYLDAAPADLPAALHGRPSDPAAIMRGLEQLAAVQVSSMGEAIRARDQNLRRQLERLLPEPCGSRINVILVGSGHIGITRGAGQPGCERILSSFPAEAAAALPERFDRTHSYSIGVMKTLKAANGLPIEEADIRDLILHDLLREAFMDIAWRGSPPASRVKKQREAEYATYLATDLLLHTDSGRKDALYGSCAAALSGIEGSGQRLFKILTSPLRDRAESLLTDPHPGEVTPEFKKLAALLMRG